MKINTLCIDKETLERFGGDVKLAVLYLVFNHLTGLGKRVYEGTEPEIVEASMGLLGVPSVRKGTKELIRQGYLERKKIFAGKPQWRFYPLGKKKGVRW